MEEYIYFEFSNDSSMLQFLQSDRLREPSCCNRLFVWIWIWSFVVFCQNYHVLNTTLVIGRRTNVRGNDKLGLYLPDDVTELAKKGKLFMFSAEDYFIMTSEGYPWHRVSREVVVGRVGYDNFLVVNALRHRVSVVDATNTLTALHQTSRDGNLAGLGSKFAGYNARFLGRFNFRQGLTSSSQFVTRFVNDSDSRLTVVVERRIRTPKTIRSKNTTIATTAFPILSDHPMSTLKPSRRGRKRSTWVSPCPVVLIQRFAVIFRERSLRRRGGLVYNVSHRR